MRRLILAAMGVGTLAALGTAARADSWWDVEHARMNALPAARPMRMTPICCSGMGAIAGRIARSAILTLTGRIGIATTGERTGSHANKAHSRQCSAARSRSSSRSIA